MSKWVWAGMVAFVAVLVGMAFLESNAQEKKEEKEVKLPSGLKYIDVKEGTGAEAKKGDSVEVHYTGWLYNDGKIGKKFDSSVDRKEPFTFTIGKGVIQGWSEGVPGMKVGGKRKLIIPPDLAYGKEGAGKDIPPNATLLFEVELLKIKQAAEVDAMRRFLGLLLILGAALPALAAPSEERAISGETTNTGEVVTRSGLKYLEVKPGTGATTRAGDTVDVHYTLWTQDGKKVDSSVDRRQPFTFKLGAGLVVKGFDEGIIGMKVGGKRKLIVPANLGYGARGAGNVIPPNAVLIFEVELLRVK